MGVETASAVEQRAAGQGVAIGVQAAALDPEQDVAGADAAAVEDAVERHGAHGGGGEVEAAPAPAGRESSPAAWPARPGTAHAREIAAARRADAERPEQLCIDLLDGEVVDEGDGPAPTHNVVDVHGDAIDADGVIAAGCSATRSLVPTPSVVSAIPRLVMIMAAKLAAAGMCARGC